jgi:serine/threonine protein kinase
MYLAGKIPCYDTQLFELCTTFLQPHNLLVGEDGVVKIADFGLSTKLFQQKLVSAGGTPLFMAPEVVSHVYVLQACSFHGAR